MSVLSELLTIPMDYSTFKNSYSPLFSSYALCLDGEFPGVTKLVLNYNRKARALWSPLVKLPGDMKRYDARFGAIESILTSRTPSDAFFSTATRSYAVFRPGASLFSR